jgi:hypothetical protein
MSNEISERVDEISKYYRPIGTIGLVCGCLFWVIAALSLLLPYTASIVPTPELRSTLRAIFIVLVLVRFALSQISSFYLVPRAEHMRRKQLLSDAFGTPLSHDKTCLYYNNQYSPSVQRLGANTLENALYSKEITAHMLSSKRLITGSYVLVWLLAFALRHNDLEVLTWITQLVFSGEIVAQWVKLEVLRINCERTFEQLHAHFLHGVGESCPAAIATVLDAFVAYESAKASAGIKLSTKVFQKLNPTLCKKWDEIRGELKMDFEPAAEPEPTLLGGGQG